MRGVDRHRYQEIRDCFLEARELPREDQSAFLDHRCGGDADLRSEVQRLLRDEAAQSAFLEKPALGAPLSEVLPRTAPAGLSPGRQVGRYRLVRLIGQGGMGLVYEAQQRRPNRRVALKVIRESLEDTESARQFEHEVEILGRLQHPGIAAIYEAGTFESGYGPRPFFAMELVEGQPLREYVEANELDNAARLNVFLLLCDAVQYAHQRGILHRDLKPGNIFVTDQGQPKILDFGIAKAIAHDSHATTTRTDVGRILGTLQYMSPEQASGDPGSVDTRSDIYSLGVILYELLTGHGPYEVSKVALAEALRTVLEQPPVKPSLRNRLLRGDLETIVLKTLNKEADLRYHSVAALVDDVRRFLENRPIEARPPSATYQLQKFAQRNRLIAAALAGVLAVTIVGTAGVVHYAFEAGVERDRAQQEATTAAEALRIVEEVMLGADPFYGPIGEPTVRDLLDRTATSITEQLEGRPLSAARLHQVLGRVYHQWQLYGRAERHSRRALDLRQEMLGPSHALTLASMNNLALTLADAGRLADAEELLKTALEVYRERGLENEPDAVTALSNLAFLRLEQDQLEVAEREFRQAIRLSTVANGPASDETLNRVGGLANAIGAQGRLIEAEGLLRRALTTLQENEGSGHVIVALEHALASNLLSQRRLEESEQLLRSVANNMAQNMARNHPLYIDTQLLLVGVLVESGKFDEAEQLLQALLRRAWDDLTNPSLAPQIQEIVYQTRVTVKYIGAQHGIDGASKACSIVRQHFDECVRRLPPEDFVRIHAEYTLARALISLGKGAEAERHLLNCQRTLASLPDSTQRTIHDEAVEGLFMLLAERHGLNS